MQTPLHDLLLSVLRTGGTRLFVLAVRGARTLRVLPRAWQSGKDRESFLVAALTPHLGDAIMLMPMLQALKAAHPATPVDLAIERSVAPLFQAMPELRRVYPLSLGSAPPVSTRATVARISAVAREYWKHMRSCRPGICIMPRWGDDLFRSFYLAVLTGAPQRIGFSSMAGWPRYRFAPYRDQLLTEAVTGAGGMHESLRFIFLLHRARLLDSGPDDAISSRVAEPLVSLAGIVGWQELRYRLGLTSDSFVVIAPGASQAKRTWPLNRWCEVITVLGHMGLHAVILSGTSDAEMAHALHQSCGSATTLVAGRTSFAESAALVQHAALYLGSDSGPAHLAGALGTPVVVLSIASPIADIDHPSSPARTRPMGPWITICQPRAAEPPCVEICEASEPHCILRIEAEDVLSAAGSFVTSGVPAA